MVLEYQTLVGGIVFPALFAVADISPVIEPCIVSVIRRSVLHGELTYIAHYHLQSFLVRRTSVTVRLSLSVLVHTEIFRMGAEKLPRKQP